MFVLGDHIIVIFYSSVYCSQQEGAEHYYAKHILDEMPSYLRHKTMQRILAFAIQVRLLLPKPAPLLQYSLERRFWLSFHRTDFNKPHTAARASVGIILVQDGLYDHVK